MTQDRHGSLVTRWVCCWCDRVSSTQVGDWLLLLGGSDHEPAVVCSTECAEAIRRDDPRRQWTDQPIASLVRALALTFGPKRTSWRCAICRDLHRRDQINADLTNGVPQRTIAQKYGLSKGAVDRHALAHLPVLAILASGRA